MKKLISLFTVLFAILVMVSCSTKFKVAAPYKTVTVVYGFLDMADTAHYIRVQKAFLDDNKNALTMAQNPDSNFSSNISVRIERYHFDFLNKYSDTIHLTRVDLNKEGYPKQAGVFFNAPNYAYKFTAPLDESYVYRIKVTNFATGEVDSADAPIINDVNTASFNVPFIDDTSLRSGIPFTTTIGNNAYVDINATYTPVIGYDYLGLTTPAAIGQMILRFNYVDSNATTHVSTAHSFDYNLGFAPVLVTPTPGIDYHLSNLSLYNAIASGLGTAPANTYRLIDRILIMAYISTTDYSTYEQVSLTQGTGLTGNEIEPIYTNLKGPNVLGLYTSRGARSGLVSIDPETVDSLVAYPSLYNICKLRGTAYH